MKMQLIGHALKTFAVITGLTLLAGNVAFAGTGSSGGGGRASKLCAYKVTTVLEMVGDTSKFSKEELRETFMNNVKWEVSPRLIDTETRKVVAERIGKNGEIYTDPAVAFYGSPGSITINSMSDLEQYCKIDAHENDEVILHELLRAARYNDEVFQISLAALREHAAVAAEKARHSQSGRTDLAAGAPPMPQNCTLAREDDKSRYPQVECLAFDWSKYEVLDGFLSPPLIEGLGLPTTRSQGFGVRGSVQGKIKVIEKDSRSQRILIYSTTYTKQNNSVMADAGFVLSIAIFQTKYRPYVEAENNRSIAYFNYLLKRYAQ